MGIPEYRVHRILRHAMTSRIFREPRPGYVAHTGPSAAFLRNPVLRDWVSFNLDEVWKADTYLVETLRNYGNSEEPADSAIGRAFGFPKGPTYTGTSLPMMAKARTRVGGRGALPRA